MVMLILIFEILGVSYKKLHKLYSITKGESLGRIHGDVNSHI